MLDKNIVHLCVNLPLIGASLIALRKYSLLPKELRIFSWFIACSLIVQLSSQYLSSVKENNLFLLHIWVVVSFILLTRFYQRVFDQFSRPRILNWIMGLFVLFSVVNSFFWQSLFTFNSYALTIESILLIIYALSLFSLLLNKEVRSEKRQILPSLLWINSGLLIYYTSGLLLFYFGDLLTHFSPVKFRISWLFHSFIYMVLFICIIIGLWKQQKR